MLEYLRWFINLKSLWTIVNYLRIVSHRKLGVMFTNWAISSRPQLVALVPCPGPCLKGGSNADASWKNRRYSTLYTPHTPHSTLYTWHFTLHSLHFTLYVSSTYVWAFRFVGFILFCRDDSIVDHGLILRLTKSIAVPSSPRISQGSWSWRILERPGGVEVQMK